MNQRLRQLSHLARTGARCAALLSFVACGSEALSDNDSGYIDLVPFYPGTAANPNAGLPIIVAPRRGWIAGTRIEYYDFGPVGNVRKRNEAGAEIREPAYANVFPIYFFFDSSGRPLFSKPAFDSKSGVWRMNGGRNPVNPAPVAAPAGGQERKDYYGTVYLRRGRAVLRDDARGSSEFQRPVIDTLAVNSTATNATGLWEIVEITVKDSAYRPDAIKSAATIAKGVADGRLVQRNTGMVINCPVVDERTIVMPSALANNIPRPRIQIWYRTKLGECYLVNGWETIGETIDENQSAQDPNNLRLFGTADLAKRVGTLDSFNYVVGAAEPGKTQSVTAAAVTKLYVPTVTVGSTRNRYAGDDIALALPRHKAGDPGGYSPIAWLWDLNVPQAPPYQPGSIKDIVNVDLGGTTARDAAPAVTTNNIAIIGAATKCVTDADCKWGMVCNLLPDDNLATTAPEAGSNVVDVMIAREGGPRCDVPAVGYGQYCSPGVARCDVQAAAGGENDKRLKAIGVASAGPTFTVHADQRAAQTALSNATSLSQGMDPADPPRMVTAAEMAAAMASLPGLMSTLNALNARVATYDALGYTTDFAGYGYFCYPPVLGTSNPPTLGGFCHIRCDSGASATASMVTVDLPVPGSATFQNVFAGEARCGGLNLLGYRCLPTSSAERQRVCMRSCNTRNTTAQSAAVCDYQLNQKADMAGNPVTGFSFSNGQPVRTAIVGQMCSPVASTCNWNAEFEPRDPAEWTGP
jgi:hypothetical protein